MVEGLLIQPSFDNSYILNDGREKEVKVCIGVSPNEELRRKFSRANAVRQGVDLCLIIDTSASMRVIVDRTGAVSTGGKVNVEGNTGNVVKGGICRLDVAKEAAKKIVSIARNVDTISLIVYNDDAQVIFDHFSIDRKEEIIGKIDSLRTNGGFTDFERALNTASIITKRNTGNIKKAILLTDGMPNCGTDEGIEEGARSLSLNGVSLDCLGIGKEFRYSFLEKLSTISNGRTQLVEKVSDALITFEELFEKSKDVVVTNAVLKLTDISKISRITEHYQGTPENRYLGKARVGANREFKINIGQVERNQLYNYYFKFIVPYQEGFEGKFRLMKATIEYSIPTLYGEKVLTNSTNVIVTVGNDRYGERMDGDVTTGYLRAEVKRFENNLQEYDKNRDHINVISSLQKIIKICEELREVDLIRGYESVLNNYSKNQKIDFLKLNETMNSSSKAGDCGTLSDLAPDEYIQIPIKNTGKSQDRKRD